jgi:hypothetical protein
VKNIKAIGISAVLALALTALAGAPSAFAEFHSENSETALQATGVGGNQVISISAYGKPITLACNGVSFTGLAIASSSKLWAGSPAFSNCTSNGEKTTVTTSGCDALFSDAGEVSILNNKTETCGGISWTAGSCTVKIPAQEGLKKVRYSNLGSGLKREILAKAELREIKSEIVPTPSCPVKSSSNSGTYQGEWKIAGANTYNGEQVGVWVDIPVPSFFNVEKTPANVVGKASGAQVISVLGLKMECKGATFQGELASTSASTLTLTPSYSGCTFLKASVTVEMRGCSYVLHPDGTFDIAGAECATKPMRFAGPGCTITIGPQSGLSQVGYVNEGWWSQRWVAMSAGISGLKYTSAGIGCPKAGTFSDGTQSGSTELTATDSGGATQGFWVE